MYTKKDLHKEEMAVLLQVTQWLSMESLKQ
jgi:hypothetical protein